MTEPIKKKYLIELSEANMDLLYTALSEVQDHCGDNGEEYYSEEDLEQTAFNEEGEDIPIQECYAEMYSKLDKVLGITNFPNEEYDPDLGDEE